MRLWRTGIAIMLAAVVLVGCGGEDDYNTKTVEGMTLSWKLNDADDSLLVKVSATTVGMVLVGFDLQPLEGLSSANIITGYVDNDTVYIRDNYGTGLQAYSADTDLGGVDDVAEKEGSETEGITEISFTIPLNSGDLRDCVLEVGQEYIVFLAWGTNDNHFYTPTVYAWTLIEL